MKKADKIKLYWLGILLVAVLDAFSTSLGTVPILGDLVAIGSNLIWEVVELALIFGLLTTK